MKKHVWIAATLLALTAVSGAFAGNADYMITLAGSSTPLTSATINAGDTISLDVWMHSDATVGVTGATVLFAFDQTNVSSGNIADSSSTINQILGMASASADETIIDNSWVASGSGGAFSNYNYFSSGKNSSGPYVFGKFCSMQWAVGPTGYDLTNGYTDEVEFTLTGLQVGTQTVGLWSAGTTTIRQGSSVTLAQGEGQYYPGGAGSYALTNQASVTVNPVPEPTSMVMLAMGALSLAGFSIRRRK
jgi:hypothetical protein